jgi:alpha-galactosidase/6-phospho-beta-glucosidase family protein
MKEKVVLIGAGSAMFTQGLVSDVLRQGWEGEIALVDIDPGVERQRGRGRQGDRHGMPS